MRPSSIETTSWFYLFNGEVEWNGGFVEEGEILISV